MTNVGFRRELAFWLENGRLRGPLARAAARYWEKRSRPVRPLNLPPGVTVVGVSGATLGGSGKTPVVQQLARELARRGVSVAVVATSYGAAAPSAVRVLPHHNASRMGDEAMQLCHALPNVPVYVGRDRQRTLSLAGRAVDTVIVDALLQTAPKRLALSILVLDGEQPWGAGACPPVGDLRARRDRLLRASDVLLVEGSLEKIADVAVPPGRFSYTRRLDAVELPDGRRESMAWLQGKRLGLLTALARPDRLVQRLGALGIEVLVRRSGADHGRLRERPRALARGSIDAWLTTAKCREQLGQAFENIPVWVLIEEVHLPAQLVDLVHD